MYINVVKAAFILGVLVIIGVVINTMITEPLYNLLLELFDL